MNNHDPLQLSRSIWMHTRWRLQGEHDVGAPSPPIRELDFHLEDLHRWTRSTTTMAPTRLSPPEGVDIDDTDMEYAWRERDEQLHQSLLPTPTVTNLSYTLPSTLSVKHGTSAIGDIVVATRPPPWRSLRRCGRSQRTSSKLRFLTFWPLQGILT
jgi:hypothetical protein